MDRSGRFVALLGLVLGLALAPVVGHAATTRSVVIEVTPATDWRAEALVRTLTADLADDRLVPRAAPACAPCDDDALRAAGIELVVRATLGAAGPGTLGYELRALWPDAPGPVRGAIVLAALDRAGLAGVLRDRLHRVARTTGDDAADVEGRGGGELPTIDEIATALALVLAVLATPIALGFAMARRGRGGRRAHRFGARAAAGRTALGIASLAAVALAMSAIGPANGGGVLLAAGGLAWGAFAAVTIPVVLPPLAGLGRIDSTELGPLLVSWSALVVRRAIAVALVFAPVVLAVALAPALPMLPGISDAFARSDAVRFGLVLPLALLIARQWVRLAIAVAAEWLDAQLVDQSSGQSPDQSPDQTVDAAAWHDAVRGYLVGYLRRNGLPIDDDLLDRVRVLPAAGDEVAVYGGGATPSRIAIPRAMLELALAPYGRPHDYAAPRVSTLHWSQWNTGLVMATEPGAAIATREQRQPRETTEADPGDSAREHVGEPPTLVGIIEPAALDARTRYRPHDDPAWLDWHSGEDHDGTDAGDRDFLFGVLIQALAQIQRHGDRPGTLVLVLRRAGRFTSPLGRLLERLPDAISDDHAAISGARHHLVQYLAWEAWQREDLLTARAYPPELEAMSLRVLAERDRPASRPVPAATLARKRLARLAGWVRGAPRPRARWRRLALAGAIAAAAGIAAVAVADAVRYHASYEGRDRPPPEMLEMPRTHDTPDMREKPDGKD